MVTRARTDVFADLEAQTHRRFIKTHTPLDGIPNDPAVTYICVGRDPRDVGLSMDHHIDNTDIGAFLSQRERAAAIEQCHEETVPAVRRVVVRSGHHRQRPRRAVPSPAR